MELNDFEFRKLSGLAELEKESLAGGGYVCGVDGVDFYFVFRERAGANNLFVLLAGAIPPHRNYPHFQRWSWEDVFPGHILSLSDPTVALNKKLRVGWYLGTKDKDYIDLTAKLVKAVARKLNLPNERIVIYGSSAGGFAAIRLAPRFPGSVACAVNPQVDLSDYKDNQLNIILDAAYDKKRLKDIVEPTRRKFSLIEELNAAPPCKIVYAQNINDPDHYKIHYKKMRAGAISQKHDIIYKLYDGRPGHTAELKKDGMEFVKECYKLLNIGDRKSTSFPLLPRFIYLLADDDEEINKDIIYYRPYGRKNLNKIPQIIPFDWNQNPYKDANWVSQLQNWRSLDAHLIKFHQTLDPDWLAAPLNLIADWQEYFKTYKTNEYIWNNMNVGMRLMKIAYILSWHRAGKVELTDKFLDIFADIINSHCEFLLAKNKRTYTNHALIDIHGLAAITAYASEELRQRINDYIEEELPRLLEKQYTANAIHKENSPVYAWFATSYLRRLWQTGWFDKFGLEALEKKARANLSWFITPEAKYAPIGDTDGDSLFKNPFKPLYGSFNKDGYAIIRAKGQANNDSYLFFMGAYLSDAHKHSDDLSLVWNEGEMILCDTGKYAYQSSRKAAYAVSTRAHNTLEINGKNTYERGAKDNAPYGDFIEEVEEKNGRHKIKAAMTIPKFAAAHKREVLFSPARELLVLDTAEGEKTNAYALYWHFAPDVTVLDFKKNRLELRLKSGRICEASFHAREKIKLKLVKGQIFPRIQGFVSLKYGYLTPNYCLIIKSRAKNLRIISRFVLK